MHDNGGIDDEYTLTTIGTRRLSDSAAIIEVQCLTEKLLHSSCHFDAGERVAEQRFTVRAHGFYYIHARQLRPS